MKTSDKLYNINANISLHFIALKQELAEIIKEIRNLEEK
jgi:hypothetical protein